ncbi:MAG: methyltransferase domain-containing protein [Phycisphaerae bacterium]
MFGQLNFIDGTKKTIWNCVGRFGSMSLKSFRKKRDGSRSSGPARALSWVRANRLSFGGIKVHSRHPGAYPEVTGYLLPTLLDYGEKSLAMDCLRWLLCIQHGDGSYCDPDQGQPYVFDTGQVLRGLLAGVDLLPGVSEAARRSADYLCSQMVDGGRVGFGSRYAGSVPESVHLYVLPALHRASEIFVDEKYRLAAQRCLEFYIAHENFLRKSDLTHFLAYELEALIDLGRDDLAKPVLDYLRREQKADGWVRGIGGAEWVCTPGLAQLAICWYKTGQWEAADRAVEWLEKHQCSNGGLRGSYGRGATYFPKVELSWALKFYLDAHHLRVLSFMARNASVLPSHVPVDDGRVRAVLDLIRPGDQIVEVGCGKGRFLRAIKEIHPQNRVTGVDISPVLLSQAPESIERIESPMEALPLADNGFDVVFSVEAIEHSANVEAAVAEMIRIAKPGGWVAIIDKQQSQWGRLVCPSWERWPDAQKISKLLNRGCDEVICMTVGCDGKAADGLMMVWKGRKRSRLTGSQWNNLLISSAYRKSVLDRIRRNQIFPWGQDIILSTKPGDRVLEVGSGTGEISLFLALAGRSVTILDISRESLEFTRGCAEELGVSIETVCGDATKEFSFFRDNQFDCVWSSGLLEHFVSTERMAMLREWSRVSSGRVITLLPNAGCLAYRIGKADQEEAGTWSYGHETPIKSMRSEFKAAGLHVVAEYSVGIQWAFSFLPYIHPLRSPLVSWMEGKTETELQDLNQGYLLITQGTKLNAP